MTPPGTIEFVDLETARAARGVRLVVSGAVPSPWGEAAKGLFRIAGIAVRAVRTMRTAEHAAWTQSHNVPVVFHDDDPPRTSWAAILGLAARLGEPGALLPTELARRAEIVGLIHELAGEDGLGWSSRVLVLATSFATNGTRGFPIPIAKYLAPKYGFSIDELEGARARIQDVLTALRARLGDRDYFEGDRIGALDIYCATFLTVLIPLEDADCPGMQPVLRHAIATASTELVAPIAAELLAHRRRMFERHLAWPIRL